MFFLSLFHFRPPEIITIKYLKKKKMTISLKVPIKGHKLKRLGTSDLYAKTV